MKKICKRCGTEYEAERHLSRYCSPTCRQYAYLERHGLAIKNPAANLTVVNPDPEDNSLEKTPVNDAIEAKQTETVNDSKPELNSSWEKNNEIPVNEEKNEDQKQILPDAIDVNVLSDLAREIRQLKEQNEKIMNEQKILLLQKQNPTPIIKPLNNIVPQNENATFSELLRLRLLDLYGADMFNKDFYDHWNCYDFKYTHWVNERLKSHIKALLKLPKEGSVDINRIKYINDKLEEIKNSFEFNHLPDDYPYINDVNELSRKLQILINNSEDGDEIEFKIAKKLRVELRAILIEIGSTAPDMDHSSPPKKKPFEQNSYYLAAKAKGFDVLKM